MNTLKSSKSRYCLLMYCCPWIMLLLTVTAFSQDPKGPPGYKFCANRGEYKTFEQKTHLAFGGNGDFYYLYSQSDTLCFNNATFGTFPPGKGGGIWGFCKEATDLDKSTKPLCGAMKKIKDHLMGASTLTGAEINSQTQLIEKDIFLLGKDESTIAQALDVVSYYEAKQGPIFINAKTHGHFPYAPEATDGFEEVRAVFAIQQGIHDYVYTADNLKKFRNLLKGLKFETAKYFPGEVKEPSNPSTSYTVKINGTLPEFWGKPTVFSSAYTLRPTGYYLAPGSIGLVTVPPELVNKGYSVIVGAHMRNKEGRNPVRRFYRVSKSYPITSTSIPIGNPFGGGIYILVPYKASAGLVDVNITNAVAAPYFSATSFHKTTLKEWLDVQRKNPGPWADFESEKYMMQVPRSWIYNFVDPVKMMEDWDKCMDGVSELMGQPLVQNHVIFYNQIDLDMMTTVNGIGYPQINNTYSPNEPTNGNKNHWFLNPRTCQKRIDFHELGHELLFSKFPGEGEAAVHLLAVSIWNRKFDEDLDSAFGCSLSYGNPHVTRDLAAVNWMVTPNFRDGKPMNITKSSQNEVQYQQRGYGKYIDIVALFGWGILDTFFHQENLDYMAQKPIRDYNELDARILRLSKIAGVDLRPLIHFWGVHPVDNVKLTTDLAREKLKPSQKIYDRLLHYKSLIPKTNTEFKTHAEAFIGKQITQAKSPDFGEGWYYVWLPQYNETHGAAAQIAMQKIIDFYFPNGRPQD